MNETQKGNVPFLQEIRAQNILSFGPDGVHIDLKPLNVLVGPNGSGKSNLLEIVSLLQAAPHDLAGPVRWGGGIRNWIWKGNPHSPAIVEVLVSGSQQDHAIPHRVEFAESDQRFELVDEQIGPIKSRYFYRFRNGRPVLFNEDTSQRVGLRRASVSTYESILSQRRDPDRFPTLDHLIESYRRIQLYRDWDFGRDIALRESQRSDVRPAPLYKDFSNLGVFLNRLRQVPRTKARLIEKLSDLYEGLTGFEMNFEGGSVQIFFEEGEFAIPATRLSDGSLRYLCLLAILLDPDPPPLIGIEEPEMGMHPDLIPKLADLLIDASSRCQLIITTHSDILIDALSDQPDSVVVCEKHDGQTRMNRLSSVELSKWLKKYRLGELWTSGELGGVRW